MTNLQKIKRIILVEWIWILASLIIIIATGMNTDHTKAQIDRTVEVVKAAKWEVA